ncbi:MAG TPA: hypothetical protein VH305_06465 [Gaiella sp.]
MPPQLVESLTATGTVRSRNAGSVAGYAVSVELERVVGSGDEQLVVPALGSTRLEADGEFRAAIGGVGAPRGPVTVTVSSPQGLEAFRREYTLEQAAKPLRIAIRTAPRVVVAPSDDPTLGARARLVGQVLDVHGAQVPAGLAVVLWGVDPGDAAPRPLVVSETQVGGRFSADWVADRVERAYGRVSGGTPIPVGLDDTHRLPREVLLLLDLADLPSESSTDSDDCGCSDGATPPFVPDPIDLTANPEAFSQDLGGVCVELTAPNRVLEEFAYVMAVRTSEPRVQGIAIDPPDPVPPALMADLLGVSIASQAMGFTRSRDVSLRATSLSLDVESARSLVRTDTPPTVAQIAQASWLSEVTQTTDLIGGGLVAAPGRSKLDADTAIDWDYTPTIYQALDIAHGHLLQYREVWRSAGYSLGKLLYSLPLAPGQRRQLAVVDWDRRTRSQREERLEYEEHLDALLTRDRDILELVGAHLDEEIDAGSRNTTWGAAGGIGAGFVGSGFGIFGGVAGGAGGSSSRAWQDAARTFSADSLQQLRDRVSQRSSSLRGERSTVVQSVAQGETLGARTETVANYNRCHSLTMEYFEVLRHLVVTHELADVRECLFVPFPLTVFDRAKALRWRDPLERHLKSDELRGGFDAIERVADDWVGWEFPESTYAEEAPETIEGELRISFLLPRPRDAEDGAFQVDMWAPLAPFLDVDPLELFTAKLSEASARARDLAFRNEVAPGIAERLVQRLRLSFVTADGGETDVPIDATLVSRYSESEPLYVTLNPAGGVPPVPREEIVHVKLAYDGEPLPPDARVIVHSGRLRYSTAHLTALLFREGRILDDLSLGDPVVVAAPLSQRELRNPRDEDVELADRLVAHLNDHLEHYHQVIWMSLDPQRRFMLLDSVLVPGLGGRSIASVCANQLVGIVGNSLVLPVAPGQRLDPTLAGGNGDAPASLLNAYATPPVPPMRLSLPTRGVHAEAVMGACTACEEIDDARYWRWTNDGQLELPSILPVGTESRATTEPDLTPTPLPAPVVSIQAAPTLPDPTGLAPALGLLSTPNLFGDVTGLAGTQANAQGAFRDSLAAASALGDEAARLATQQQLGPSIDRMIDRIDQARTDGMIDPEAAQALTVAALEGLIGDPGAAAQPPFADPLVTGVIDGMLPQGGHIVTETDGETVDVSFDGEAADAGAAPVPSAPLELVELVRVPVLSGLVDTYEKLAAFWGADLATAETLGLVAHDPEDAERFVLERRLRIVYPTAPNAPTVVSATGPLPLVVLVHGDHPGWTSDGTIPNLDGYAYLQDALARSGIVSVSVDTNAATALGSQREMRADLILGAFDSLRTLAADASSPLFGRLDFGNVGLLGHGSGGDAVADAAQRNAGRDRLDRLGIQALCLLGTTSTTTPLAPTQTGFLAVLHGGLDGELAGSRAVDVGVEGGFEAYDRATCDKAMVFLDLCGHERFNTVWAAAGDDPLMAPADLSRLLPAADHQALAAEYVDGLFRWRLLGDSGRQVLFDGTSGPSSGAAVSLQHSFGSQRLVLDGMGLEPEVGARALDEATVEGITNVSDHTSTVLVTDPSHPPAGPVYTLVGDEFDGLADWREYDAFTLRVGSEANMTSEETIAAGPLPDFSLTFTDLAGGTVVVSSSQLSTPLVPRRAVFHQVVQLDGTIENRTTLRLETMIVPVSLLEPLGSLLASVSITQTPGPEFPLFFASLQLVRY